MESDGKFTNFDSRNNSFSKSYINNHYNNKL